MTSRSYTTPQQMLFQFYGVRSWTELWEHRGEIEILQAHIQEGLLNPIMLRSRQGRPGVRGLDAF